MANLRHPFRLNIGFIINKPIGYNRDFDFDFSDIQLHPDLDLTMLTGSTRIGRTPQGLLVQGKFSAAVKVQCVRCLTDTEQKLQTEFDELYAFNSRVASESELILSEDGYIDLEPILREYFLIELPISPLCKPDCKGLCSVCGQDLNQAICEHQA